MGKSLNFATTDTTKSDISKLARRTTKVSKETRQPDPPSDPPYAGTQDGEQHRDVTSDSQAGACLPSMGNISSAAVIYLVVIGVVTFIVLLVFGWGKGLSLTPEGNHHPFNFWQYLRVAHKAP